MIFNLNDLTAGAFWQNTLPLYDKIEFAVKGKLNIAVIGYGALGRRLIYKGLLLNLFSVDQKIRYHIFDDAKENFCFAKEVKNAVMNGDRIVFHKSMISDFDDLSKMDIIIISEDKGPAFINDVLNHTQEPDIYYYDPEGVGIDQIFTDDNDKDNTFRLHAFGDRRTVIKSEKIFNLNYSRLC